MSTDLYLLIINGLFTLTALLCFIAAVANLETIVAATSLLGAVSALGFLMVLFGSTERATTPIFSYLIGTSKIDASEEKRKMLSRIITVLSLIIMIALAMVIFFNPIIYQFIFVTNLIALAGLIAFSAIMSLIGHNAYDSIRFKPQTEESENTPKNNYRKANTSEILIIIAAMTVVSLSYFIAPFWVSLAAAILVIDAVFNWGFQAYIYATKYNQDTNASIANDYEPLNSTEIPSTNASSNQDPSLEVENPDVEYVEPNSSSKNQSY